LLHVFISDHFLNRIEIPLKIQAVDIQAGDRIIAYCNNKMQICKVRDVLNPNLSTITLSVSTSENSRNSISRVVRFQRDALVELHARGIAQEQEVPPGLIAES
jgi:hypothetical protein